MSVTSVMDDIAMVFEWLGTAILVGGLFWSAAGAWRTWRATGDGGAVYRTLRSTFGGALLLGLEVLVAADLIRTVAVAPTLENILVLGLIVLIRTFLSVSLQVEIEGVLPWRRAMLSESKPPPELHPPPAVEVDPGVTRATRRRGAN